MEAAEYIRDERGEAQSVRMDISEYEAAKRELGEARHTSERLESLLTDLIKTTNESGVNFYEQVVKTAESQLIAEGRGPEDVKDLLDRLEDLEARVALDDDFAAESRGELSFAPFEDIDASTRGNQDN